MKTYPPIIVVDEDDNELGSATSAEVWRKGLYHRIVSVFVVDDQGRMLLQLRGSQVKVYPNCWDQAAGGHVDVGSSYDQAAQNEVTEETGLDGVVLTTVGTYRSNTTQGDRIINQFERIYVAHVSHDVKLRAEQDEVSKLQWFTPTELRLLITEHPANFTPGLLYALRQYFPLFAA
jgi:isopentenyl-diphosphate Delta-isomerase